jgi:hypothetical protein
VVVCLIVECANVSVSVDRTHEECGLQMVRTLIRGVKNCDTLNDTWMGVL